MTYTTCPICSGSPMAPPAFEGCGHRKCPCTETSTPGYSPTGLTMPQIDRMVVRERAMAGDVGMPHAKRGEILAALNDRVHEAIGDWSTEVGL